MGLERCSQSTGRTWSRNQQRAPGKTMCHCHSFDWFLLDESLSKPSNKTQMTEGIFLKKMKKKKGQRCPEKKLRILFPTKIKCGKRKNGPKKTAFSALPKSWNLFLPTKSDSKAASLRHSLGHQPAGVGFRHRPTLKKGQGWLKWHFF